MTEQPHFYHNVYFWLNNSGDALKLAEGCQTNLSAIPGIVQMTVGIPAGTARDVVDNTYGVALLVEFESKAAYEVYEDHPDHLRFIAECSRFWSRVQVYDTVLG